MHSSVLSVFIAVLALFMLSACTGFISRSGGGPGSAPRLEALKAGDIVFTRTGEVVSFDEMMKDLAGARIVYVGEVHTNSENHSIQLKVAEALYARNPSLGIAMEMFPRDDQDVLNEYVQGKMPDETFIEKSDWQDVWGYPFRFYRGLLHFARDKHLKLIGLNMPPDIAPKIARGGVESLTPEERSKVARHLDLNNAEHKSFIREEFEEHAKEHMMNFENFYEAQVAWEDTMAETLAGNVESGRGPRQVLVIIGNGHINYRFGVPERVWKRVHHTYRTVMPLSLDYFGQIRDPKLADYVWITKLPEDPHKGRLGILVRVLRNKSGLEVLGVQPGSPADRAGLKKGDIIVGINGDPLHTMEQLHKMVARNSIHELRVRRGDITISVTVFLKNDR